MVRTSFLFRHGNWSEWFLTQPNPRFAVAPPSTRRSVVQSDDSEGSCPLSNPASFVAAARSQFHLAETVSGGACIGGLAGGSLGARRMALGARLLLGLALLAALIGVLFQLYRLRKPRLWTLEELSIYNGTDEGLPILLGILGSVFDVTKGRSHYGPGGGYHHFSGRDASRAFVSGNFTGDGLTDSLQGLSSMEVNSIVDWRKLYFDKYTFSGKIVGRYYDSQGNPTKYLKGVEMKAKRGAQLLEKQKSEEDKIPNCNSKWSQAEGGEVWCEAGAGYPRLVRRPGDIALTGKVNQRCACFQEAELGRPGLVVYEGCDYLSTSCKVK